MKSTLENKSVKNNSRNSKNVRINLRDNRSMRTNLRASRNMKTGLGDVNIQNNDEATKKCPSCGSVDFEIDYARSEVSCKSCGLVLEENIIDFSPSGTAINRDGQNLTQNGAPCSITKHDKGLATDFKLENLKHDRARWARIRRLQKQSRVSGSRERNLARAFSELSLLISNLSLPRDVNKEAASIYRRALEKDLVRGRSISLLISASLYAACRVCRVPRTFDEIAEVSTGSKKSIAKNYRFLNRELALKIRPASPVDYIPRFASMLELSSPVVVKSIEIINELNEKGLIAGKTPAGVAAAALYYSSRVLGERRTQKEIASVVGVTEVTIRTRYKEMTKGLNLN